MSAFHEEQVLSVHHWTDRLFSFTTTRDPSFRFSNGHFSLIGLRVDGKAGDSTMQRLFSSNAIGAGSGTQPTAPGNATPIPFYVDVTPNPQGGYVTLREGNSGTLVRNLQQAMKDQGYFRLTVDGLYGVGTTEAVREFQRRKGLSQDGVAGPATQRILFEGNYPAGS